MGKKLRQVMAVKRVNDDLNMIQKLRDEARTELMQSLRQASMKEKVRFIFEILRAK